MKRIEEYEHHYALKGKMYLSFEQKQQVNINIGTSRYIYNQLVAINKEIYQLKKILDDIYIEPLVRRLEYLLSLRNLTNLKNAAPFVNQADCDVCDASRKNYNQAWKNYAKGKANPPTFKKKGKHDSYQTFPRYSKGESNMLNTTAAKLIDESHVYLPKVGVVRVKFSQKLIKKMLSRAENTRLGAFTVSREANGEYFVSVSFASDVPFKEQGPKTNTAVGIDLNLDNFLMDSDGKLVDNPKYLKRMEKTLKREQRKLSKRGDKAKKDNRALSESRNYQKQKKKVANIHKKVVNQRKNFHFVLANEYVKNHDIIVCEDLKVRNMIKNHCLAKAIADVGWRGFLTKLEAQATMVGKELILINPKLTTQTCSDCGYVLSTEERLTLKDREWICPSCGVFHIRDINAAKNILNKGMLSLA